MSENGVKVEDETSEVKKATTGLGAIFGHIQQNKEALVEETKPDPNSWSNNVPLSQLCDIGGGLPKSFKSQRVSSWFCEICQVDLNSEVTYNTHVSGAKHKKKEKNLSLIQGKSEGGEPNTLTQPVKKSKKPVLDFRELVRESKDPLIGLQHLTEIFPDETGDHDAMYSCELCCCESTAASMFAHIKGHKHREKYLGMKYNIVSTDKSFIIREANRVEVIEGRRLQDMKTVFDEEKYPWPIGKRPGHLMHLVKKDDPETDIATSSIASSLTTDPDGIFSRDFVRRGYNFDKHKEADTRTSLSSSTVASVLSALQASKVKSEEDAEMAHQVAAHLVRALAEYKEVTGDPREARLIKLKSEEVLEMIYQIRRVRSVETSLHEETSWRGNVVEYGHGQPSDPISARHSSSRRSPEDELSRYSSDRRSVEVERQGYSASRRPVEDELSRYSNDRRLGDAERQGYSTSRRPVEDELSRYSNDRRSVEVERQGYSTSRHSVKDDRPRSSEDEGYLQYLEAMQAQRRMGDASRTTTADYGSHSNRTDYRRELDVEEYRLSDRGSRGFSATLPNPRMASRRGNEDDEPMFGKRLKKDSGLYMYH